MLALPTGHRPNPAASALPIIDLRPRLPWRRRLPGRLGTLGLWLGSGCLLGPAKLAAVLLAGSLVTPCLLMLDRQRAGLAEGDGAQAPPSLSLAAVAPMAGSPEHGWKLPPAGLLRADLAAELGLPEAQLFRARHSACCTVHHDEAGRIVALEVPTPALPLSLPKPDAHPVG